MHFWLRVKDRHSYTGHLMRTIHQADNIEHLISGLGLDEAILTMDYKMKLAAMSFRESQQNYFGKRGMCWHGAMLHYRHQNEDEGEKKIRIHYFDQVIENDTVQDFTSVACCLESALTCIKEQFPFIKRLTLVSDNAKCYSGNGILGSIVALSITSGIKIERLVHGEAGEGKSELDAHFGCAFAWLERFVNAGNDVLKPSDVVAGLRSYGGMPNSSAHLLSFNVQMCPPVLEATESGEDIDEFEIEPNSKGRAITPLGSFLSELKPKLRGNITEIRDAEVVFSSENEPVKIRCRPYSGFNVTEVPKLIQIFIKVSHLYCISIRSST